MILNERKIRILEAIINDYILTAEPIGSRTIAKKYDLGISSATVRNEMSDLEEMGFIIQPHASAGRIPSDKGYRYYVDHIENLRELTDEETYCLHQMLINNINQIDFYMSEVAKYIALLTNYTTIVSKPVFTETKIKHVQLVPLDENHVVLMLVTENKTIKNSIVSLNKSPSIEELGSLSAMLNSFLTGKTFVEITDSIAEDILLKFKEQQHILAPVLDAIVDVIKMEDNVQIYTSGVKNILAFPEFNNISKARGIFQTLEEKDMLITLLGDNGDEDIRIVIGSENNVEQMKDCSIIKANYKIGDKNLGTIGVIGPTRMDYIQTVSVLNGIIKNISKSLSIFTGG